MNRSVDRSKAGQSGQAMTETLVIAAAVLPFLLAVPLLAKYQDIRHASVAASRTVAFECATRPQYCADGQVAHEMVDRIRRRHFGRQDIDLHSHDTVVNQDVDQESHRFWRNPDGRPMIARFEDVSVNVVQRDSDALRSAHRMIPAHVWQAVSGGGGSAQQARSTGARSSGSGFNRLSTAASKVAGPDAFGLALHGGLVTAQVQARVPLHPRLAEALGSGAGHELNFGGRLVILTDGWNASSAKGSESSSLQSRVEQGRRLPSMRRLADLNALVVGRGLADLMARLPGSDPEEVLDLAYRPVLEMIHLPAKFKGDVLAPGGKDFRRRPVDVEVVPEDRLGKYGAELP
ncbi:MAG: hypothetical protein Q4A16_03085 [Lautropia sp.]|nr:hypothetical protein [Lautropia sp.]